METKDEKSADKPENPYEPLRGVLAPLVSEGASDGAMAAALNAAGFRRNGREWCHKTVSLPLVQLGLRERNLERFYWPPSFSED
nr:hypothetical protein 16 [bacterium]